MPWVSLQCVIVVFLYHIHLLFYLKDASSADGFSYPLLRTDCTLCIVSIITFINYLFYRYQLNREIRWCLTVEVFIFIQYFFVLPWLNTAYRLPIRFNSSQY